MTYLLGFLSLAMTANGLWMLASSEGWFQAIAADVSPFNLHFVRDVGDAFLMVGVALGWAALRENLRGPLVTVAAVFLVLHGLGHLRETLSGDLGPQHWLEDIPGVYLPALLTCGLAIYFMRRREAS